MKYITKIVYSTQAHSKAHIVLQHKCTLQYSRRATNGERDRQGGMNAGGVKKDGRWRANSAAGRRRLLSCTNAQTSWSCTNYYDSFWVQLRNGQTLHIDDIPFERLWSQRASFLFAVLLLTYYWQEWGNRLREFGILSCSSMRIEHDHSSDRKSRTVSEAIHVAYWKCWAPGSMDERISSTTKMPHLRRWLDWMNM